jgi:hypothetical protein
VRVARRGERDGNLIKGEVARKEGRDVNQQPYESM